LEKKRGEEDDESIAYYYFIAISSACQSFFASFRPITRAEWLSLGRIYQGCAILLIVVALFALVQVRGELPVSVGDTSTLA
jgi:hypothetical protein